MFYKYLFFTTLVSLNYCAAPENPSFSKNVQPIFTSTCATATCHAKATAETADLNLSEGSSYDAIVSIPSTQVSSILRVSPGDANNSYLYMKVTGAPGIQGVQMPKIGFLSQVDMDTIANWINNGAENN